MSHILQFCRSLPEGRLLDERMARFGMRSFDELFRRVERLRKTSCNFRDLPEAPKKIVFLSRVTLGADVAITSVLMQRLARQYPEAELVLLGSDKLESLFGAHPRLTIRTLDYVRRGGLLQRLQSWFSVLDALDREAACCADGELLVVDPDSRLSQLGVMPLLDDRYYLFFNSRTNSGYSRRLSISEMANFWVSQATGMEEFCHPAVWLPRANQAKAASFAGQLRAAGCRRLVAVNFGVGGNARKRIDDPFERDVLLRVLADEPDTVILLDKGFGAEELGRTEKLMQQVAAAGYSVQACPFADLSSGKLRHGLVAIEAGIGEAAALIAQSNEFIGYDSACQHIAAALEIPAFTIFAGSNNTRFVRRWRPFGLGRSEVIHVDTLTHPPVFTQEAVLLRLMHARRGDL